MKRSRTDFTSFKNFALGAPVIFIVALVFFSLLNFGYGQYLDFQDRRAAEASRNAPATDFFKYQDILVRDFYYVGESIEFTSVRAGYGDYPASYLDKIFCPSQDKKLKATAFSLGSIKDTEGEVESSKWDFGNFEKVTPFERITLDLPATDCYVESLITIEDEYGNEKKQTVQSSGRFEVIVRE